MAEEFISDIDTSAYIPSPFSQKEREITRILVIGTKAGIEAVIYELHQRQFTHIDSWSKIMPIPGDGQLVVNYPGASMSICTKHRTV